MKALSCLSVCIIFLLVIFVSCSKENDGPVVIEDPKEDIKNPFTSRIQNFTFMVNGVETKGKIHLPAEYESNKSLPAIYLIDFTEQHFDVVTDEFEEVIRGVVGIQDFEALVVSLESIPDIDSSPLGFQGYYDIYKNMASYVDNNFTDNTSRTFIGKGSEGGVVMQTLFLESLESSLFDKFICTDSPGSFNAAVVKMIDEKSFPLDKNDKRFHFSFSTSNDFDDSTNLINKITEAQYSWLAFESKEYTQLTYNNAYKTAFADGLKFVFK